MEQQQVGTGATPSRIVMGVGLEEVGSALAFAADEASRSGCGLHLVHALHVTVTGLDAAVVLGDAERSGREALAAAVRSAEDLVRGIVPVTSELAPGPPVPALVEAGRSARMVVLEHRHLSRLSRVVNRTVAGGVAARLRVPVVAVPTGWARPAAPVVVAGVDVPDRSDEVLRAAVAESRVRGAALRIVHTWSFSGAYEDVVATAEEPERWAARARAEVCAALDRLGNESVATDAEVVVRAGRAAEVLVRESEGADLLVIGRHDPLVPLGSHIGPVARAVLREASCPVLLASPHQAHRRVEQAGVSGRGGF